VNLGLLAGFLQPRKRFLLPRKNKRVISFSLWGDKPLYLRGALENATLSRSVYPGWICRFYVDCTVPEETVTQLRDAGCEIVYKRKSRKFGGLLWRFEAVFDDPDVDVVIVRDADGRLGERERRAVDQWIESGKSFHVMRDHPNHRHPMMGGMWGVVPARAPWFAAAYARYAKKSGNRFWADMDFLRDYVWEKARFDHHANDEYFLPQGTELPFPTPLADEWSFVGNKYDENNRPAYSVAVR
jgi:hypothetical protein